MDEAKRGSEPAARQQRISRRDVMRLGAAGTGALAFSNLLAACGSSSSSGGGTGTEPSAASLRPYDASAEGGSATDLAKIVAFPGAYNDPTSLSMSEAMSDAAKGQGFRYVTAVANGDISKATTQTEEMLARGFSATFMYPGNEPATRPLAQRVLDSGACLFGGAGRPYSTVQIVQDQATTGRQLGRLAADWIRRNLDGRAQVVYFNEDSTPTLVPRHRAVLAELTKVGPGVEVVSDIEVEINPEAGASAMSTILQAHPGANVILGGSGPLGGAYAILDSKGKAHDSDIFVASVSGSDADMQKIASGDTVYRATIASPWPLYGWAMGTFAADWQAGRSIPRLMSAPGGGDVELTSPAAIATFRADMKDPEATWKNRRERYIDMWGNIDYTTRDSYWRTEARVPSSGA